MAGYIAPVKDMIFNLNELAELGEICKLPYFAESDPELIYAVLEEASKFAGGVLAPLNSVGDLIGSKIIGSQVREASGFAEAYQKFVDAGWSALPCDPEYGGMGLPECTGLAVMEMWSAANISFALCPMLGQGAIEAIESHASEELKNLYLAKIISGQWTGTMNLTEPQAGSDLAAIRTKAIAEGDHYRLEGSKIFITWGDHSMTENIVHLVLARVEGAPEGVKGISLFLVPKYLVSSDGSPGERNDVYARSVEHKIGIHGSPTCVMQFGGDQGATGYLIGEENMGLSYMFTMMNHARLNVGVEGVALSDRAYQQAARYAKERVQGHPPGQPESSPIIYHADVRRMLMVMRSLTEASRALCYVTAAYFDFAHHAKDSDLSSESLTRAELLTPMAKAWSTEVSQEVTSLGIQIHGGMGYIEETGAAQLMRDARITTIYEGTTGIQANDLIGRKVLRDSGKELTRLLDEMRQTQVSLDELGADYKLISAVLAESIKEIDVTTDWLVKNHAETIELPGAVAVNFLMGTGTIVAGWLLAKSTLIGHSKKNEDPDFYSAKSITTHFYFEQIMPRATAYFSAVHAGSDTIMALSVDQF